MIRFDRLGFGYRKTMHIINVGTMCVALQTQTHTVSCGWSLRHHKTNIHKYTHTPQQTTSSHLKPRASVDSECVRAFCIYYMLYVWCVCVWGLSLVVIRKPPHTVHRRRHLTSNRAHHHHHSHSERPTERPRILPQPCLLLAPSVCLCVFLLAHSTTPHRTLAHRA